MTGIERLLETSWRNECLQRCVYMQLMQWEVSIMKSFLERCTEEA